MPQNRRTGLGQLTRMLNNFWTAVFEQSGPRRQNAPIREVITLHDAIEATEQQTLITNKIPLAIFYEDFNQEGTDQLPGSSDRWGATGLNNHMWFPIPAWPSPQSFWVAGRIEQLSDHNAMPADHMYLFGAEVTDGGFHVYYDATISGYVVQRGDQTHSRPITFSAGAVFDFVAAFDANDFGLSLVGVPFERVATGGDIGFVEGGKFYIGRGVPDDANSTGAEVAFLWVVLGVGPVTDQMAEDLFGAPNDTADWEDLPASVFTADTYPVILWPGVDNTHVPSEYGKVEYWTPSAQGTIVHGGSGSLSGVGTMTGDAVVPADLEFGSSEFDTGTFG